MFLLDSPLNFAAELAFWKRTSESVKCNKTTFRLMRHVPLYSINPNRRVPRTSDRHDHGTPWTEKLRKNSRTSKQHFAGIKRQCLDSRHLPGGKSRKPRESRTLLRASVPIEIPAVEFIGRLVPKLRKVELLRCTFGTGAGKEERNRALTRDGTENS